MPEMYRDFLILIAFDPDVVPAESPILSISRGQFPDYSSRITHPTSQLRLLEGKVVPMQAMNV